MFAISPTDIDWFEGLRISGFTSGINFWTPTPWNIAQLKDGDRLYFMLKSPIRRIGGFGEFREYCNLSLNDAWIRFGKKNGCGTKEEFADRLDKYKSIHSIDRRSVLDSEIGCIVLDNVEFWDSDSFLDPIDFNVDFSTNIVKIKYYKSPCPFTRVNYILPIANFSVLRDNAPKYTKLKDVVERKGQGIFRAAISRAYKGACCITGETTPELIEAAHIQQYLNKDSNHVQNGVMLRVDFHKLFDNGLMTIDNEYCVEMSSVVHADYYRSFHGRRINLPDSRNDWPSQEALALKRFEFRVDE